ncbi:MAG: endolytic transglycosylase MltG [Desulfonatronovibrionaceae bacterium]
MRKTIISTCAIFILCLAAALAGTAYIKHSMTRPQGEQGEEVLITIAPGESFAAAKSKLAQEGLLHSPRIFTLWARITGKINRVQAGEFRLNSSWSQARILEHLVSGREALYRLSIPEGLARWETARIVENSGLCDSESFLQATENSTLLRALDIQAATAEGFLFPDTYFLPRRKQDNASYVLGMLVGRFRLATAGMWEGMDFQNIRDIVTLASLVEKETAVPEERRRIAGVFVNRLNRGMRLQCDPTVIYGIKPEFDGNLKKEHLRDPSNPYNTYRHSGLPPGPICSPGLRSLKAALDPEEHDFLYFVSRRDGSHKFSRTLAEHNQAVREFQLGR